MKLTQLSVFIENRHGRIANVASILKKANVNMLAISLAETQDYAVIRMIVDNVATAEKTLRLHNMTCLQTPVIGICVDSNVGSLSNILTIINDLHLNIEYVYTMAEKITAIIFRFENTDDALKLLEKTNLKILTNIMLES